MTEITKEIIEDRWMQAAMTTERTAQGDWDGTTSELYDRLDRALSEFAAALVSYEVPGEDVGAAVDKAMAMISDYLCAWALDWYTPEGTRESAA